MSENKFQKFLDDYQNLIKDCCVAEKEIQEKDKSFNLFELIADKYKHENFHSDIIAFFLNPTEKHNSNDEYLKLFLSFLNSFADINKNIKINFEDYKNSEISREENRIDILIKDRQSKHAIIIENKINDATDTHLQLPTYVEKINNQKYIIDAIVYLSKDGYKTPSKEDWKEKVSEDIIKILDNKMVSVASFNSKILTNNLVTGWLNPSINKTKEKGLNEIEITLIHYSKLLEKLNIMTEISPQEKDFFDKLINKPQDYENAFQIKKLLESRLAIFFSTGFKEKFKKKFNDCAPFENMNLASNAICQVLFDDWKYKKSKYYLRVQFDYMNQKFEVVLRDRFNNNEINEKYLYLEKIGFIKDGYGYIQYRNFSINSNKEDESLDALVIFIHDVVLKELQAIDKL